VREAIAIFKPLFAEFEQGLGAEHPTTLHTVRTSPRRTAPPDATRRPIRPKGQTVTGCDNRPL
jgi:hypothetical protein